MPRLVANGHADATWLANSRSDDCRPIRNQECPMTDSTFDSLTRRAATTTRRGTLAALGAAGLLGVAAPDSVSGGKSDKKARKRARKKGKKKCRNQEQVCEDFFETLCSDFPNAGECEAVFSACCVFLGACQATAFFDCVFTSPI
jgi:hypothetical protein